ncbi:MAG: T9SS type A sorting domain-containing protein, partial [Bacteroidota bacterium]|nr:T9SS type A sorting domain-containing protein [Bacteroidota bacterium]
DSIGDIIWDRMVGTQGGQYFGSGSPTTDGGLVAIGSVCAGGGDITNFYGGYDPWIIKLDSDGETDWDFSFGTSGFEFGHPIIQTSDGGYLAGSSSHIVDGGNIDCEPYNYNAEAVLFKLDANGNEEWYQCYGGSGHDGIIHILELEDGYIFSAVGSSNDGDLESSGWHGSKDIWLVKTDFSGNIIWQKCYGGSDNEEAQNVFQTSDGGFIVFGTTNSSNGDVVGNPSNPGLSSIWVFKISSTGELIWQQCIGSHAPERVYFGVIKKSDYNYVVAGEMNFSPSGDVNCGNICGEETNYWVFELTDTTTAIHNIPNVAKQIKVYPNPAQSYITFELPQLYNECTLNIVDVYGKLQLTTKLTTTKTKVDVKTLNPGVYIYSIKAKGVNVTGRVVKVN